jgi:HAD superfamily hydrolase (TIGR01662 family)
VTPAHQALRYAVVVPTLGRPSLGVLLASLVTQEHPPREVVVVDDRRDAGEALDPLELPDRPGWRSVRGGGRGPAHARNAGWRALRPEALDWVVFVDDDVRLPPAWSAELVADLAGLDARVGGSQAVIEVPLPGAAQGRRPTDWERGTAGLQDAIWATAEMAYRPEALAVVNGFDERFPRAFREDADLALRVRRNGFELVKGRRRIVHPVRPADPWVSVRVQRGNADDALMRRLHGPDWMRLAECPPGRLPWHVATVGVSLATVVSLLAGRRRLAGAGAALSLGLLADFAWRRIAPGPRDRREVLTMSATSAVIPFVAVWHRLAGEWRHRHAGPWPSSQEVAGSQPARPATPGRPAPVRAVLFDRDGTLVHDVPYNGEPDLVQPVDGAREAVQRLRDNGISVGVVTNQSAVGRGMLTTEQVAAVNERVDELIGPFDTWQVCPHAPDDGCDCRKPAPGLVHAAAEQLGVAPHEVVVVGDIGSDVRAAEAAGATGVLVPNAQTRHEEVAAAPVRAATLTEAVDRILGERT